MVFVEVPQRHSSPPSTARALLSMCSIVGLAVLLAGCSPTLDWRSYSPEGSGIRATFPCRADRVTRRVELAGTAVTLQWLSCAAGGVHYALAFTDVTDPTRLSAVLAAWRDATLRNMDGQVQRTAPAHVAGMTANDEAVRVRSQGRLPDGRVFVEEAAYFVHGLRVYQAVAAGSALPAAAIEPFFGGLQLPAVGAAQR